MFYSWGGNVIYIWDDQSVYSQEAVDSRLERHLSAHKLHEERQSAYKQFHSTESALLCVQNDILRSLDQNEATVLVMLDLSTAFDTIDHSNLLCRLEQHFGIVILLVCKPLQRIKSYLGERHQTVCVNAELSKPVRMTFFCATRVCSWPKDMHHVHRTCRRDLSEAHTFNIISTLTNRNCTYNHRKPLHTVRPRDELKHAKMDIILWMNNNFLTWYTQCGQNRGGCFCTKTE